jgi:predicted RNA-binding Zn ribbon-like protein
MVVTRPPTAADMRFDGGHPALELVNTIYGQVGGPVEHDVLATPQDLVVFARRLGFATDSAPAGPGALAAALELRDALDPVLRACLAGERPPAEPLAAVQLAVRAAYAAAELDPPHWTWPDSGPLSPVHRLAHAAAGLLTSEAELERLRCCAACRWLFLDHSRGAGRRWCSMADCGTEAKKRRYIERRRARRAG